MSDDRLVDLSISPEAMLGVREDVRLRLVKKVHFLRLSARLYRKAGDLATAQRHEASAQRLVAMIRSIEPLEHVATWPVPKESQVASRKTQDALVCDLGGTPKPQP